MKECTYCSDAAHGSRKRTSIYCSACPGHIGVASGMAGRALALPIMPPERDVAARDMIEVFAEYSLAHIIYVCAQPIIFSLLRLWDSLTIDISIA